MTSRHRRTRRRVCALALSGSLLILGIVALDLWSTTPAAAAPKETTAGMGDVCRLAGGSVGGGGDLFSCCWPGWGCVHCYVDPDGTIDGNTCWVDCSTQACTDANARDRLGLPPKKKGPQAVVPSAPAGTLAPQQTPKPKTPAVPGAGTVQ